MVSSLSVARRVTLNSPLGAALQFDRLEGREAMSGNFEYRLSVLTRRGDIHADEILGKPVSIAFDTPKGALREFNGIATAVHQLGLHGRYHRYAIELRPWTWLLTRTRDCRIFQNQTIREILETVFADHPYADFEFQLIGRYSPWIYCVQYRESDFNFIARLMEQEGMYFFWRHQDGKHTLVIADGIPAHTPVASYETLSWLEPEDREARREEGVRDWTWGAEIKSTSYVQRDYNFEHPRADMQTEAGPARQLSHVHQARFEVFDYPGEYEQREEGERLTHVRIETERQQFDQLKGEANAAGLTLGRLFTLTDHPRGDQNREYLVTSTEWHLVESPLESELDNQELFTVRFGAIPAVQTYQHPRLTPRPIVQGPQTAMVVGPAGDEIHTDGYGRVKVQFHWDRYGQRDQNSSCWIRVASDWAGQTWGMIALPRIGQEVIVDFLEGDPDRPLITGRVYNADQIPPWRLPEQIALAGYRSRELKPGTSGRGNHLIFDDSGGKIQTQLKSDHDSSSLSLGHITRIDDNAGRKDYRGEGFELRTDGRGIARAAKGLVLTTEARANASAHITDIPEALRRLKQAGLLHQTLTDLAQHHDAQDKTTGQQQSEVTGVLRQQHEELGGTSAAGGGGAQREGAGFPELEKPHLVLSSPAGIETTTEKSTHFSAIEHIALTSGLHTTLAVGRGLYASIKDRLSLFVHKAGMKLIAASGKIELQAQSDNIELTAQKVIELLSTQDWVRISGKKGVLINGEGSYIKITAAGIEHGTNGKWVAHAAAHNMVGPKNIPIPPREFQKSPDQFVFKLQSHIQSGFTWAKQPYSLYKDGGLVKHGVTDEFGHVVVDKHDSAVGDYKVVFTNGAEFKIAMHEELQESAEHHLSNKGYRSVSDEDGRHDYYFDKETS